MRSLARNNAIQKADTPIHDWYRFVLSYPPHLVRQYIERFELRERDLLCDPFCGTGTTLVEAKKSGIRSVGCDAHPFAVLVSRVKTDWSLDVCLLSSLSRRIVANAEEQMVRHRLPPLSLWALPARKVVDEEKNGHRLNEDEERLLPAGFLSERPLQRLLILRDEINAKRKTKLMNLKLVPAWISRVPFEQLLRIPGRFGLRKLPQNAQNGLF